MNKEYISEIDSLCKRIEALIRENFSSPAPCDYFVQKALNELYMSVFDFMHFYTLKTLGVKNGNEKI